MSSVKIFITCLCIIIIYFPIIIYSSSQGLLVDEWARQIGDDLLALGRIITKAEEIEVRYMFNNAQIQRKDPEKLLAEIVGNVTLMLNRKMDAIKCIAETAEEAADELLFTNETFTYRSSKYSSYPGTNVTLPESIEENADMYEMMEFNRDSHFYNISVNTSYSSVHVPTNVYDKYAEAAFAIQWSERLDEVFRKNYEADPALFWQYFGSSSGILRHYPAMSWVVDESSDSYDCRVTTWYIEAATCTKDIVILLDSSGSMLGMNKYIASLTVYTILRTLSNNDYVNVLNYSVGVNYTVPCFANKLIQATRENIDTFKIAVNNLDPQGKTDAEIGLIESFRLLESYRKKRNCTVENWQCSQAIMLITDGVTKNYTDLFLKYNRAANGTIPVRIFTYLIGKEVGKINEIASMACLNRGYYTHITDLETVTNAVFKYINVIARPLILQAEENPISWTHTYIDIYTHDEKEGQPYRLLTSAAIPVYDRKDRSNLTDDVQLLGIAGTDVTIESIQKLTFPYKLGVNAHAFIVTNNGYVLMHPGLRPMFKKEPTPNYNSIDFTEVQQLDDNSEPRELAEILNNLRAALILQEKNVTLNVPLKYHYSNMRKVSRESFDFYYQKIKNTPFTMALALPNRFGYYAVQPPDEIHKNKHARVPILDFFNGSNWSIHPKWVYCKYHYLEGHEFVTPEEELLHFLPRIYNKTFKWNQQYQRDNLDNVEDDLVKCDTETKRLKQDDYYCDRELINMLIFDAKSTMRAFDSAWSFKDREEELFRKYNATLRFVATMSGLTRWEYIFGEKTTDKKFNYSKAIDETWYKSAVLQHQYDKDAFVFAIPLYEDRTENMMVTGSYAIFPKDASFEAPASVVGFEFSHSHLVTSFFNTTVNKYCSDCLPCGEHLDCYIIDNSGYVIVSHNDNHTGKFFGEFEGCVLESMMELKIFDTLTIYDYQSLCYRTMQMESKEGKCSVGSGKAYSMIFHLFNWIIQKILWLIIETHLYQAWYPLKYAVMSSVNDKFEEYEIIEDVPTVEDDDLEVDRNHTFVPCDHKKNLYILNQTLFISGGGFVDEIQTNCPTKSYYTRLIPHTNLLLVAVNVQFTLTQNVYSTKPVRIVYENETYLPCQKLALNDLTRERLSGCFNYHPKEVFITECGYSRGESLHIIFSTTNLLTVIITLSKIL